MGVMPTSWRNKNMKFYSTKNRNNICDLKTAVIKGMPDDGGLYMPARIPQISPSFLSQMNHMSINDIAKIVLYEYLCEDLNPSEIHQIVQESLSFDTPLIKITDQFYVLELFHGPTLAFKDIGARFMSRLLSKLKKDDDREINMVVATSGDTGSAVASGFNDVEGIRVFILYPSEKISENQKKQITTYGDNIHPMEIKGTFDDCQRIVKQLLRDPKITTKHRITTANSINIARLLPQIVYYFKAVTQLNNSEKPYICVPSGNFGNLCAGILAKKMGLGIHRFIAATNINDVIPQYLLTGEYQPKPSKRTLSNAMDVGNPSNFERILEIYQSNDRQIKEDLIGMSFTDEQTKDMIKQVYHDHHYLLDPHGAVGFLAMKKSAIDYHELHHRTGITLETAHPAKFKQEMDLILGKPIDIPMRLKERLEKQEKFMILPNEYDTIRGYLCEIIS